MKKNLWWLVIVFVAVLLVSNMLVQAKEKEKVTVTQWEYKAVSLEFKPTLKEQQRRNQSMLNQHGKAGWELCAVFNTFYYFKREIKE